MAIVRKLNAAADTSAAVDAFMAALEHPFKREIALLRGSILAADPAIAEGIKWNAPSFRTDAYFLTVHLRARRGVALIFHRGAQPRTAAGADWAIPDPAGLLEWLAADRAMATFHHAEEVEAGALPLQAVVRAWIAQL